ncbi:low affinity immunoglobulin gamma Fc region receptor II isoform X3 [Manis pentadactyla]|uniref:low affinity immunoglobulin gamma Fc region receptor II isoform X3 n=1 Tax=Manis pentadactyla TaxID=143292 RepID=UPI00255CE777|nr:low affinity immunoglobulin gamma Fc region receptor II isoform X3 [Manis pentadactyla]
MVTINLQPHQPACSCGHFSNSWTVEAWKMQVDFMETGKSKGIKGLCKEVIIHSAEPPNPNSRLIFAFSLTAPVAGTPADLPKAVVDLEPPWINVLREDYVTLRCRGSLSPEDTPTQWFFNGSSIRTQVRPRYGFKASSSHRGDYRCQTDQTSLSDPVHLDVISDWLLLQTPRLVFQEPEPILLRCHSWKNKSLYKVTFFQDGKPRKFSHMNSSFSIPRANVSHSGSYHCTGVIGQMRHSSRPLTITVQGSSSSHSSLVTIAVAVVIGIATVAILAAIVTWLHLRQKRTSALLGTPESREMGEAFPEEPEFRAWHTGALCVRGMSEETRCIVSDSPPTS